MPHLEKAFSLGHTVLRRLLPLLISASWLMSTVLKRIAKSTPYYSGLRRHYRSRHLLSRSTKIQLYKELVRRHTHTDLRLEPTLKVTTSSYNCIRETSCVIYIEESFKNNPAGGAQTAKYLRILISLNLYASVHFVGRKHSQNRQRIKFERSLLLPIKVVNIYNRITY